jgi:hypothetical protein
MVAHKTRQARAAFEAQRQSACVLQAAIATWVEQKRMFVFVVARFCSCSCSLLPFSYTRGIVFLLLVDRCPHACRVISIRCTSHREQLRQASLTLQAFVWAHAAQQNHEARKTDFCCCAMIWMEVEGRVKCS